MTTRKARDPEAMPRRSQLDEVETNEWSQI